MTYPNRPGYKGNSGTSESAAIKVSTRAPSIRRRVWDALQETRLSGESLAEILNENLYSVLPRISEMQHFGIVQDSGFRDTTHMGCEAVKWERVPGAVYADKMPTIKVPKKQLDIELVKSALAHLGMASYDFHTERAKDLLNKFITDNSK